MKKITFIITGMLLTFLCKSQSVSIADASIEMDGTGTNFTGTYLVELSDTNNVSQIEVQIGSNSGLTDVLNSIFDYDVTTGLPSGFSYQRSGKKLTLGIGTFTDKNTLFGSVRVKDSNGNWSSPYQFITN